MIRSRWLYFFVGISIKHVVEILQLSLNHSKKLGIIYLEKGVLLWDVNSSIYSMSG